MLIGLDDYPVHQSPHTLSNPTSSDANFYDRYFFNGYTPDGGLYFGAAMGLYPNRCVIDGAFSVVIDGRQVSVLASDLCPDDRTRTEVGPIRVEIVEPLEHIVLHVDAPEQGLRAQLVWKSRTVAAEEPHFFRRYGIQVFMNYTRYTQWGAWSGWIEVDGRHLAIDPGLVRGSRDRSWGIRPVGEQLPGPRRAGSFFWLWAPVNFDDVCTHMDVTEEGDGTRWHETGFVLPTGDSANRVAGVELDQVDYTITWRPGTRWAERFEMEMWKRGSRERHHLVLEPQLTFQMAGIGYGHPTHGHGRWHGGTLNVRGDSWMLADVDPSAPHFLHVQQLCRATYGDRVGTGILEVFAIGPHAPTGLTGIIDGHQPG